MIRDNFVGELHVTNTRAALLGAVYTTEHVCQVMQSLGTPGPTVSPFGFQPTICRPNRRPGSGLSVIRSYFACGFRSTAPLEIGRSTTDKFAFKLINAVYSVSVFIKIIAYVLSLLLTKVVFNYALQAGTIPVPSSLRYKLEN